MQEKKPRQPRAPSRDWTKEPYRSQLKEALKDHFGNITQASKALRATRDNISKIIRDDPELTAWKEQCYEGIYSKAVDALAKRVEEGNMSAIALVMRVSPWAKRRGWGDHMQISGGDSNKDLATQARDIFGLQNQKEALEEETKEGNDD